MLRVALCDDDKNALPVISGAAVSAFEAQNIQIKVDCFCTGRELLQAISTVKYQIVLLDIDMPEMDGIEVGKKIRSRDENVEIIYASGREDKVFDSFAVYPLGFVRKSNFLTDMTGIVTLYKRKYMKKQKNDMVKFTTRNSVQVVRWKQISYIEGSGNYQLVHINSQKEPLEIKMTMDGIEELLEPYGFIRIHKGYLVNYLYILRIQGSQVILKGEVELPLGRSKAKEVKSRYLALVEG